MPTRPLRALAKRALPLSLVALSSASGAALAIPSVEQYADLVTLSDGRSTSTAIVFKDDSDSRVVYIPYDRVTLENGDDGRPRFGLVYDEQGGFLSFSVRATYSADRKRLVEEYKSKGYNVRVLPPISGGWTLSIDNGEKSFIVGMEGGVKTVLPDVPVAMSFRLKREGIAYITRAFATGSNVSLNYVYTFRGSLTPMRFRAEINWSSFQRNVQDLSIINTMNCSTSGDSSIFPDWLGGGDSSSRSCASTSSDVRSVVRAASETQSVKIWSLGGGADQDRLLDELTRLVLAKTFKPLASSWAPLTPMRAPLECSASGSGSFSADCAGNASTFVYNAETIWEDKTYTYDITSQGVVNLTAAVGGSLNAFCDTNAELFVHARTGAKGCPTVWDDRGIRTSEEGGPWVAPISGNIPSVTPPVLH